MHRLHLCRRVRPPLTSVLDMTLAFKSLFVPPYVKSGIILVTTQGTRNLLVKSIVLNYVTFKKYVNFYLDRRKSIIYAHSFSDFLSDFSYYGLTMSRFLLLSPGAEISSALHRRSASVAIHVFFTVGCMLLALLAYFIRTWRVLTLMISLPSLPLALLYVW